MTSLQSSSSVALRTSAALARRFEAVVLDWDLIAAAGCDGDRAAVRTVVERACAAGLELGIVSGGDAGSLDALLSARPAPPGTLLVALDHGSEVHRVDQDGARPVFSRAATAAEQAQLSRAARLTVRGLAARGISARIVAERPSRRRLGLAWGPGSGDGPGEIGVDEALAIARAAAGEAGLAEPRVSSDGRYLDIDLVGKADAVRWIVRRLWAEGIAAAQMLIAVDQAALADAGLGGAAAEPAAADAGPREAAPTLLRLTGGPAARVELLEFLEDQIERRQRGELPIAVEDPEWTVAVEGVDRLKERVQESLLTLADGRLGTRGTPLVGDQRGDPAVLMAGVYTRGGAETHLLAGPRWNTIAPQRAPSGALRRLLDLHAGLLVQRLGDPNRLEALLFSSLQRPGTSVLRARGAVDGAPALQPPKPPSEGRCEQGEHDGLVWMRISGRPASIVAAACAQLRGSAAERVLDRVAAYEGDADKTADERVAIERARRAHGLGFDRLLSEHRRAWASRWEDADVRIVGDRELQLAVRFALFHLLASVAEEGEAAVGARGLSGSAYRGHVFWDSDVFVLPFLAATRPRAARAMLEYRLRRLPAALRAARRLGRDGARFPWESARTGRDVTPRRLRDPHGQIVEVLTGQAEEHIVADVAWAAACYIDWSGDQSFATGGGRELLVQTARWWASRIELDEHGRGHIRGVIGPDEYHENVDDNAYTNVMARWNLRRAAQASVGAVAEAERRRWLQLADQIVDGYDPHSRVYEQFAGFYALEPLLISELAPQRPVAADMLLGHERTGAAQVLKQADVLMLHYLVPDETAAGSLAPNLDFYEPRTAHGSTLSPGVHAALLARAGRVDEALAMLRLTARIDLDDIGHTTAGGLHLAAMGSVWRALAFGFAGLRPVGDALAIDPVLPAAWGSLQLRVRLRASRLRLEIRHGVVQASADPPATVLSPAGEPVQLGPSPREFAIGAGAPASGRSA
jgi:trehalose/maltose hydrolase-like predicted phosphorylase